MIVAAPRPSPTSTVHTPLRDTLRRIADLGDGAGLMVGPRGSGWIGADQLALTGDELESGLGPTVPLTGPERRAVGSQLLERYLRFLWPVVMAFGVERRVPDVAAWNLMVRLEDGWPVEFALVEPRFAVLRGDPAEPAADVMAADPDELAAWMCDRAVERNIRPFLETVRRRFLTSDTALWGNVAAAFVHPLLWRLQLVADDPAAVIRDAEGLLDRLVALGLGDRIRLDRMAQARTEWTVASRRACCLSWSLPGGANCAGCPLLREPEASTRLQAKLDDALRWSEKRRPVTCASGPDRPDAATA